MWRVVVDEPSLSKCLQLQVFCFGINKTHNHCIFADLMFFVLISPVLGKIHCGCNLCTVADTFLSLRTLIFTTQQPTR